MTFWSLWTVATRSAAVGAGCWPLPSKAAVRLHAEMGLSASQHSLALLAASAARARGVAWQRRSCCTCGEVLDGAGWTCSGGSDGPVLGVVALSVLGCVVIWWWCGVSTRGTVRV